MSSYAEDVLYSLLSDVDALEVLATEGLDEEAIPTVVMRPVVAWCIEQFFKSGRRIAPTNEAIKEVWGHVVEDAQVDLGDGTEGDSIEFAIDTLKSNFVHLRYQERERLGAAAMSDAQPDQRITVLSEQANDLFSLALRMQPKRSEVTGVEGFEKALTLYDGRAESGHITRGMTLGIGMEMIDQHLYGIHEGELCTLAAGPKVGKSYFLDIVALRNWARGRTAVLYTLENSIEMTMDRMVCAALGIDSDHWQRGEATQLERDMVAAYIREMIPTFTGNLHILKPEPGARSVNALVRHAQMLGAQDLFIDQLTFMEPEDERAPRPLQIRQMTHDLKTMISTGRDQMSCMLAHQINREGVKAAEKVGRLEMYHLAEGSEVERTSDLVLGAYQSDEQRNALTAQLQILAARRVAIKSWSMALQPHIGRISNLGEIPL